MYIGGKKRTYGGIVKSGADFIEPFMGEMAEADNEQTFFCELSFEISGTINKKPLTRKLIIIRLLVSVTRFVMFVSRRLH